MTTWIAAAAQMTSTENVAANLVTCRELAAQAASKGSNLLAFPECFGFLGRAAKEQFRIAEVLSDEDPGPILKTLIELAREHNMWIIGGGDRQKAPELLGPDGEIQRTYNTCVAISPTGRLAAAYRKIHLFDLNIPGQPALRESDSCAPGTELTVLDTEFARLGLSICYDLRFPELYREVAVHREGQVLLIPAAFTAHTGAAHWNTLLRARAIENQCFVIAPAQVGRHNDKRETYGHTQIIDPWGDVLAQVKTGVGLAIAEIDMKRLDTVRTNMPCHAHQVLLDPKQ